MADSSASGSSQKNTVRLFFAVEVDEAVRRSIADVSMRLQKASNFTPLRASWIPAENFHLTLYFLGEVSSPLATDLAGLLPEAASSASPFTLDVRKIGVFPAEGKRPPRVLWVGVHNPPSALLALRNACASIIARCGLPVPDQDFSPHITIARFKSTKGVGAFRKILGEYEFTKPGKCDVTRLVLMRSITGGGPARYVPFATAPLGRV